MSFDIHKVRETRLFRGLKPLEIAALLESCAGLTTFDAGQVIFAEGQIGSEFFILPRGRVRILLETDPHAEADAAPKEIMIKGPDIFGEMAFLDQSPRSATAIAAEPLIVYVLDRDPTQAFMNRYPAIGLEVMRNLTVILAGRIRRTNGLLLQEIRRMGADQGLSAPQTTDGYHETLETFVRRRNNQRIVRSIAP